MNVCPGYTSLITCALMQVAGLDVAQVVQRPSCVRHDYKFIDSDDIM